MAGTGKKGYTGSSADGRYTIRDGLIQSGSSGSSNSGGSSPGVVTPANVAQAVSMAATGSGSPYADYVREMYDYSAANSAFNAREAAKARDWSSAQNLLAMQHSASEAQKTRDWQERLSDTAHQREVKDLIGAGLNPVLSANHGAVVGSGATGQGFTSSASSASADSSASTLAGMFSSMITSAANLAMQDKQHALEREALAQTREIAAANREVQLISSENALAGDYAHAGATLGSARMTSEANRYGHELNYLSQERNRLVDQYMQQNELENRRVIQEGINKTSLDRAQIENMKTTTGAVTSAAKGFWNLLTNGSSKADLKKLVGTSKNGSYHNLPR